MSSCCISRLIAASPRKRGATRSDGGTLRPAQAAALGKPEMSAGSCVEPGVSPFCVGGLLVDCPSFPRSTHVFPQCTLWMVRLWALTRAVASSSLAVLLSLSCLVIWEKGSLAVCQSCGRPGNWESSAPLLVETDSALSVTVEAPSQTTRWASGLCCDPQQLRPGARWARCESEEGGQRLAP